MNITDEQLIAIHENLIYKIALSFYNIELEDLFQVGVIGLLKAKKNYKQDTNSKFSTYAYEYIYGEMYQFVQKNQGLKIGRDILQLSKQISKVKQQLTQIHGREVTTEEIAIFLEKPVELIYQAMEAAFAIISYDQEDATSRSISEYIPDQTLEDPLERLAIEESMQSLNEEEKKIIDLRYYQDLTQSEIAKLMGMSQVTISRYEKKGMDKMRSYLSA